MNGSATNTGGNERACVTAQCVTSAPSPHHMPFIVTHPSTRFLCIHTHAHTLARARAHMYTHMYTHTHSHTHTHTHTCTHTETYGAQKLSSTRAHETAKKGVVVTRFDRWVAGNKKALNGPS